MSLLSAAGYLTYDPCRILAIVMRVEWGSLIKTVVTCVVRAMHLIGLEQSSTKNMTEEGDDSQMIRKLASGEYRLYSRKKDRSGKRRNLGTFKTRSAAQKHERAVQYLKRHG